MEDEHARYQELKQLLDEREKSVQQLREETTFLDKQYKYTKNEVWRERDDVLDRNKGHGVMIGMSSQLKRK